MLSSRFSKAEAEKYRTHILQAFESVLGSPVTIEIRCESNKDIAKGIHMPIILPTSKDGSFQKATETESVGKVARAGESVDVRSEIVELPASPQNGRHNVHADAETSRRASQFAQKGESTGSHKQSALSLSERRRLKEPIQSKSLVKSKVSLAHVIQQAEGCAQPGWPKRKAVSIAEKLEQENLYVYLAPFSLNNMSVPFIFEFIHAFSK